MDRPRLFTSEFTSLLMAQAGFGYAFSSFFMLPQYMDTELSAGPAEIGRVAAVYGATVVVAMPLLLVAMTPDLPLVAMLAVLVVTMAALARL